MRQIIFILSFLLVLPAFGQRNKKEEEPAAPVFTEGVAYALPRTGIRIEVKAVKETFEAGPYAQYADLLLGIKDAKPKTYTKWAISEINLFSFSEPDPAQMRRALGKAAILINMSDNGCLSGINAETHEENTPFVQTNSFVQKPRVQDGFSFSNFNDTPYQVQGDSTNGYRAFRAGIEQKAAEAARRIYDCRTAIFEMATGKMDEFHPDGEAYKVSLNILQSTEKNYVSLFTGRSVYEEQIFSFDYVPSALKGEVVFRFSDEKGPLPSGDLTGKPIMAEIMVEKEQTDKLPELVKSENPKAGASGIYYRIPVTAVVNLLQEMKTIATTRMPLAQFGAVAPVPEELLTGSNSIFFYPETGAIKSIQKK